VSEVRRGVRTWAGCPPDRGQDTTLDMIMKGHKIALECLGGAESILCYGMSYQRRELPHNLLHNNNHPS
jgi:hypothetical protein